MFLLAVMEDKLKTIPEDFNRDPEEVLVEQIQTKYGNKVMVNVGLFVRVLDFKSVGDPYVYPAEGAAHQIAVFRMIVFRPFLGEILLGTIYSCHAEGLRVTLGFFDDIIIPAHFLPQPCEFNPKTSMWTWKYEGNDFEIECNDTVRFKVRTINFTQVTTTAGGSLQATTTSESQNKGVASGMLQKGFGEEARTRSQSIDLTPDDKVPAVMHIVGSIDELGLGIPIWW